MNKIIIALLLVTITQQLTAQTETFDIITYTPPNNFIKNSKQGVVTYSHTNSAAGSFCIIAVYAGTVSAGDEKKDFSAAWKELVMTPYEAAANPKTATRVNRDGWKVVAALAQVKMDDVDAYALLTVFSGFGKRVSVMSVLNDQSYAGTIDSLLDGIKLDKNAAAVATPLKAPVLVNANEPKGQFGTVQYAIPKGWNVTKYPDGDILAPAQLPKNEFLEIWVQPSMNFSGTMEQALQKSYDETAAKLQAKKMNDVNGGNYAKVAAKISFRGWEYIRCSGGIQMGGGDYPPEYGLDLFLIKINGRYEQVAIIKSRNNCNLARYYPSERLKYYNEIENFLFSLQFADWKEPDVKTGIAKGEDVNGTWQGISMSVGTSKPGADLGAELKVKQLIFFSNGQAFFGNNFPAEGLDELNTWVRAENYRRDWGTFTFSNGKGVLKLPYADFPLRMENSKLIITANKTDHRFVKTNAVDGARFNGTYALSSRNIAGEETGKTPLISFTADGKFTDNGAMSILYHEYNDCLNAAKEPGSGTYEVKNYSVIFNYTDGRKIKVAFPGTAYDIKNPSPPTLMLSANEDALKKT